MFRNIIIAVAATATIGAATIGTADARDRYLRRHHNNHNGANVIIGLGGFGGGYGFNRGYYGDRFDRGYGYGNDYYGGYGGVGGYGFRDRFAGRFDDDFGPYCDTRRVKVKKWNRAHTRYVIKTKRIRSCY
jgi:hypothetical protein